VESGKTSSDHRIPSACKNKDVRNFLAKSTVCLFFSWTFATTHKITIFSKLTDLYSKWSSSVRLYRKRNLVNSTPPRLWHCQFLRTDA